MKVGLIGVGRLGICFALLLEEAGYEILASDVRESYVNKLQRKEIDTHEPQVPHLLKESENFEATTSNERVIKECDVIYTLVATPSTPEGDYDVSAVWQVVEDIKSVENVDGKALVVGCTTNPGDCEKFQSALKDYGVHVYYNPEFIAQGTIVSDLRYADMVLIGGEGPHVDKIQDIYRYIQVEAPEIFTMSTTAAELVKLAVNCFLTTKIGYANMVGDVMSRSGMSDEISTVLGAIGADTRVGKKYLKYGYGFGGPCLPRDNRAFAAHASKVGLEFNLGSTTDSFNDEHAKFLVEYFCHKNVDDLPFYFDYVTYKKGTDIIEESQQLRLCEDLLKLGYKVYINEESFVVEQIHDRMMEKYPGKVTFVYDKKYITEPVFPIEF
tara:strand:- start:2316 stop:3464 length:1149 start_codon:yes stop_codon:yes gene_type:complete